MGLSSNSIIHFTQDKNALIGILNDNFKLNYCREKILLNDKEMEFFVPMVSFCDIPLSQVKKHIDSYGTYGIGLTKEWAEREKLNPVFYLENKSSLSFSIRQFLVGYLANQNKQISTLDEKEKSMLDIIRYMKNYQADLSREGHDTIKNYRFSDEREWRYVLNYNETEKFVCPIKGNDKKVLNESISKYRLKFQPNDIKYIIINDESEISEFIALLRSVKGKYSYQDVERLITRIITADQIREDF